ncbi:MAG: hypothetical protein GC183_04815 [Thiobacillus sp.]|nr:hypothetical protein [Thiobacillus sp.]
MAAIVLIGACWFAAWPYMGLCHDSRLYALEAFARLSPGIFDRDLFLAYGSQGGFTLFPSLFGGMIKWLGLESAAFSLALAGKLFWFAALVYLARQLMPAPIWFFACLPALAFPAFYDSHEVFSYGESFATPRIFAEAFTMLALAAWARGRHIMAAGLVFAAGAMHPLMALPGGVLLALLAWAEFGRKRLAWLALGGLAVLAATVAVYPDLGSRLISSYDPAWYDAVRSRNPFVFLDTWDLAAFDRMAWLGVVLALVATEGAGPQRRFALAALLTACGLLALSWLGAVVWKNILLTQLQLWRALWLAQIVALLLSAPLLLRLWKTDYASRILASCLVAAYALGPNWMVLITLAGVGLRMLLRRFESAIDTSAPLWRGLPYMITLPVLFMHLMEMPQRATFDELLTGRSSWRMVLADRLVLVLIGVAAYWGASQMGKHARYFVLALSGAACVVAASSWQPIGVAEDLPEVQAMFVQMKQDIPPGAVVQSTVGGGSGALWFVLERAGYISQWQTAGALFNRENALEGVRRLILLGQAGFPDANVKWHEKALGAQVPLTSDSVRILCSDEVLDYVVMGGSWAHAQHRYQSGSRKLSLFACEAFR